MSATNAIALGDIMALQPGWVNPSNFPNEVFDLYSIPAFDNGVPEVVEGSSIGSNKQIVEPGDVLLSKIVPHIRRAWIVGGERERRLIASGEWIVFRSHRIHPAYLRHVLVGDTFHTQFMSTVSGVGGSLLRARPAYVAKLTIPLPPLPQQRRTANVLDQADALRRKRRESQKLLDDLLRSAFLLLVSSGHRDYPSWPKRCIEQLAVSGPNAMRTGPFGSALRHSEFVDDGVAVLGIDNAVNNRFAWGERRFITHEKYEGLRRYTVRPGDVIITIMGTTGRSAVVPDDIPVAITTKHLATITVNRALVNPEFLANAVHLDPSILRQVASRSRGAIMDGLNLGLIRELELHVPPMKQQERFVAAIGSIRFTESEQHSSCSEADRLFASLLQSAFS